MEPFVTEHATPVATDTSAANNSIVTNNQLNQEKEVGRFSFCPPIFFGLREGSHTNGAQQSLATVAATKHNGTRLICCSWGCKSFTQWFEFNHRGRIVAFEDFRAVYIFVIFYILSSILANSHVLPVFSS
jgi:hypothetical protein